jgi:putative hydrolase of the HAD superfamily
MIDLYIFDMGGVLCRDFDVGPLAAGRLGLSLEAWRRLALPDLQAFMRGELDPAAYWRRFSERSGIVVAEDLWTTFFRPRMDEATADLVRALRAGGARVVAGTNTIAAHYDYHLRAGQYDCFDAVHASHLMGRAKPEPEFWLDILSAEGARPERCFFVDDYPENVEAARELGLVSRLYVDAERLGRDLVELGAPLEAPAPGWSR